MIVCDFLDGLESSYHIVFNDGLLSLLIHCSLLGCTAWWCVHEMWSCWTCGSVCSWDVVQSPTWVAIRLLLGFPSLSLVLGASMQKLHSSSCLRAHLISSALVISLAMWSIIANSVLWHSVGTLDLWWTHDSPVPFRPILVVQTWCSCWSCSWSCSDVWSIDSGSCWSSGWLWSRCCLCSCCCCSQFVCSQFTDACCFGIIILSNNVDVSMKDLVLFFWLGAMWASNSRHLSFHIRLKFDSQFGLLLTCFLVMMCSLWWKQWKWWLN